MRKILTFIMSIILINAKSYSQASENKCISFEDNISWDQVKNIARLENKYIFVDCYTTWCIPCRKMEVDIYRNPFVVKFVNEQFVSLKLQMDSTIHDKDAIKSRYQMAHDFMEKYNITAFPTFLFFSADGLLLHRGLGYQNATDFIKLTTDAKKPERQYYTVLDKYKMGKAVVSDMSYLMSIAKSIGDEKTIQSIGFDYTRKYLSHLEDSLLMNETNLALLRQYTTSTNERGFGLFYKRGAKIDSIMNSSGYALRVVDKIIYNEEVAPKIEKSKINNSEPDWKEISDIIQSKYSNLASEVIIDRGKTFWYKWKKQWSSYTKSIISLINDGPAQDRKNWFFINSACWEIFLYSKNSRELKSAIRFIKPLLKDENVKNSALIDTYANLLYKIGKKRKAIEYEELALQLSTVDKDVEIALSRMKKGLPTWESR